MKDKRTIPFHQLILFSHYSIAYKKMITSIYLYFLLFISFSNELNNGLGRTPQMGKRQEEIVRKNELNIFFTIEGWNSWNHFGCRINETIVRQIADAIVATGLAAAGYQYGMLLSSCFLDTNNCLFFLLLAIYSESG
jgi:hypothetical protein